MANTRVTLTDPEKALILNLLALDPDDLGLSAKQIRAATNLRKKLVAKSPAPSA